MKTLQELLEMKVQTEGINGPVDIIPDFRVAVQGIHEYGVHIIIHPMGHNGDTLDLMVKGNNLSPVFQRPSNPPTCDHGISMGAGCKKCGRGTPVA